MASEQVEAEQKQRRRVGEKDTKGTSGGILDAFPGVVAGAMVRQWIDPLVEDALESVEGEGVRQRCLLGDVGLDHLSPFGVDGQP